MNVKFIMTILAASLVLASCTEKPDDGKHQDGEVVIPELPADPHPDNTAFQHRIILLQHTGTGCINCPNLMASLKTLSQDAEYSGRYQHVAAHSYNNDDLAYSTAAANVSQAFCSGFYPELTFNLTNENTGTSLSVETIKSHIDGLYKDEADAGISAAVLQTGGSLGINVCVKSAKKNQYRVAVWLLEDEIRCRQTGASEDWMNTHNNALRAMAGSTLNLRIYGEKVGELDKGDTAEKSFILPMEDGWNAENCKVLVIVNAARPDGRYDLANCAICPIGDEITYTYR